MLGFFLFSLYFMVFLLRLLILCGKTAALFVSNGTEFIFELFDIATLYIPNCLDELYAFHAEFLTKEYIISVYGEEYYRDFLDFCYGDSESEQRQHSSRLLQAFNQLNIETQSDLPEVEEFDNEKGTKVENLEDKPVAESSEEENTDTDTPKKKVRIQRRRSPDPHPGFYEKTPAYLEFLSEKLNPNLHKYSSSKDLLGERYPPSDGSLVYDFFSDGIPKYKFPQYVYSVPDYPFETLPNLSGLLFGPFFEGYIIGVSTPFDGYSLDGLLLNKKATHDPVVFYKFSKDVFVFSKTMYDFIQNPGPLDPELEEFFLDLYRAFTRPRYVRKVFYKSKRDIRPKRSFNVRKRVFKKKK
jgi:hypothetical protein